MTLLQALVYVCNLIYSSPSVLSLPMSMRNVSGCRLALTQSATDEPFLYLYFVHNI